MSYITYRYCNICKKSTKIVNNRCSECEKSDFVIWNSLDIEQKLTKIYNILKNERSNSG